MATSARINELLTFTKDSPEYVQIMGCDAGIPAWVVDDGPNSEWYDTFEADFLESELEEIAISMDECSNC